MGNNCTPNRNPYRNAQPQSCLFISAATNRPAAQQQLPLISAITADLEASARKGARGLVFSLGNLQSQGPAPLNPEGGAEETEEQGSFSPKETQGWVRNQTRTAVNTPALAPATNNHGSPESEQLRTHLWLHLGAALQSHLEVPESQVITIKLFPKLIFWAPHSLQGAAPPLPADILTFTRKENHVKAHCPETAPFGSPSLSCCSSQTLELLSS